MATIITTIQDLSRPRNVWEAAAKISPFIYKPTKVRWIFELDRGLLQLE